MCVCPVLKEKIAESEPVKSIPFLVVVAYGNDTLVHRDGAFILLKIKMALGIGIIIYVPFVWSKGFELWNSLVKVFHSLFIIPFMVIANADICTETCVQFKVLVQLLEQQQRLMILPGREIFECHTECFGIFVSLLSWQA